MRSRFAGMVLNALLAGQVAFGAAAVAALAMKDETPRRLAVERQTLAAAAETGAVVR